MLDLPRFEFGLGDLARTLERLAPSVGPETAQEASSLHRAGARRAVASAVVLLAVSVLLASPWAARCPETVRAAVGFLVVAVPALAFHLGVFRRVAWSGRVLVPCLLLPLLLEVPAGGPDAFFGAPVERTAGLLAGSFLVGFLFDVGTGGFFGPRTSGTVLRLPLVFVLPVGLWPFSVRADAVPRVSVWIVAAILAAGSAVALAARLRGGLSSDASRLARFASVRDGRRLCGKLLAAVLLTVPALLALVALAARERFDDSPGRGRPVRMHLEPGHQQALPLFGIPVEKGDPSAVEFSVYCEEADGILTEAFVSAGDCYDVPFVDLVDPSADAAKWPEDSPHYRLRDWLLAFVGLAQTKDGREAEWLGTVLRNAEGLAERENALPADVRQRGRAVVLWADRNVRLSPLAVRVCDDLAAVDAAPLGSRTALEDLREALAPYRVTSRSAHEVGARMRNGFHSVLFLCRETPVRSGVSFADGSLRPRTGFLCEAKMLKPKPMDSETLRRIRVRYGAVVWPTVACIVLAGLLLGARGGDSPTALFLGIAVAIQPVYLLAGDSLLFGRLARNLWTFAVRNEFGGFVGNVVGVAAALSEFSADVLGWLCVAAAFVALCWPSGANASRSPVFRFLRFAGKTLLVALSISLLSLLLFVAFLRIPGTEVHLFWIDAVLQVGVLSLAGRALRRRRAPLAEAPVLDWRLPAVWLCLVLPFRFSATALADGASGRLLAPIGLPFGLPPVTALWILCVGCALAALAFFVEFALRTGFLSLLTAGRLSIVVLTFLVPVLSEAVNGLASELFSDTGFLSGAGNKILGILFTALVMSRFWETVVKSVGRLLLPGLRGIEDRVRRTLEASLDRASSGGLRAGLDETLRAAGVRRWSFFRRTEDSGASLAWQDGDPPSATGAKIVLTASKSLFDGLGGRGHVVDSASLSLAPGLFFLSFELRRLMDRIGADQLLPVSLGRSFRGFLAASDSDRSLFERDAVAAEINNVALELARGRGPSGRVQP